MNSFFNGIAHFFEDMVFPVLDLAGRGVNFITVVGGFIAMVAWIVWEIKNRTEPDSDY